MRAMVVLPTPRVPVNRKAWCTRPRAERIHQRPAHVLLADELGEFLGAPFARQRGVAHERSLAQRHGGGPHQLKLRHPTSSLPLLPSGPDGIHDWSSRRNRCGPPWSFATGSGGGEGGIRTHEHPLGCYWNSSPAPSTARPPLQSTAYKAFRFSPVRAGLREKRRRMIKHAPACRTAQKQQPTGQRGASGLRAAGPVWRPCRPAAVEARVLAGARRGSGSCSGGSFSARAGIGPLQARRDRAAGARWRPSGRAAARCRSCAAQELAAPEHERNTATHSTAARNFIIKIPR